MVSKTNNWKKKHFFVFYDWISYIMRVRSLCLNVNILSSIFFFSKWFCFSYLVLLFSTHKFVQILFFQHSICASFVDLMKFVVCLHWNLLSFIHNPVVPFHLINIKAKIKKKNGKRKIHFVLYKLKHISCTL